MLQDDGQPNAALPHSEDLLEKGSSLRTRKQEKILVRKRLGERLQQAFWQRRAMDPSFDQHSLATSLGVTPQAVSQWLSGTSSPSAHRLHQLADLLHVDIAWLRDTSAMPESGKTSGDHISSPLAAFTLPPHDKVIGCVDERNIVSRQIVDYMAFKKEWLEIEFGVDPENVVLITAISDAMSPTIRSGDLVLVDKSVHNIRIDSIYVFCQDNDLRIKRAQALFNGTIRIKSDNHEFYDEQELTPEQVSKLNVFGRVLLVSRRP